MSLLDSSQIYTKEASIPVDMCPSYTEAANKVKNMLQIHTTNGPVILPPYHQEMLSKDEYCWHIENYYIDWTYNKRAGLFDGRGWL